MRRCISTPFRSRRRLDLLSFGRRWHRAGDFGAGPAASGGGNANRNWHSPLVWGIYGVVASVGGFLASDVYRAWSIRRRIENLKDDPRTATQERVRFIGAQERKKTGVPQGLRQIAAARHKTSEFTAQPIGVSDSNDIAILDSPFTAKLLGNYSDLPGQSRFFLSKGDMEYTLNFVPDPDDITGNLFKFSGSGKDAEGNFSIEGGRFNSATGRLAWGERSQPEENLYLPFGSDKFTLYAECKAEIVPSGRSTKDGVQLKGWYEANTGRSGELRFNGP